MDHGTGGGFAYTIDGQSLVLRVQETSPPDTATARGRPVARRAADPRGPADVGAGAAPARLGRAGGDDRGRTA